MAKQIKKIRHIVKLSWDGSRRCKLILIWAAPLSNKD